MMPNVSTASVAASILPDGGSPAVANAVPGAEAAQPGTPGASEDSLAGFVALIEKLTASKSEGEIVAAKGANGTALAALANSAKPAVDALKPGKGEPKAAKEKDGEAKEPEAKAEDLLDEQGKVDGLNVSSLLALVSQLVNEAPKAAQPVNKAGSDIKPADGPGDGKTIGTAQYSEAAATALMKVAANPVIVPIDPSVEAAPDAEPPLTSKGQDIAAIFAKLTEAMASKDAGGEPAPVRATPAVTEQVVKDMAVAPETASPLSALIERLAATAMRRGAGAATTDASQSNTSQPTSPNAQAQAVPGQPVAPPLPGMAPAAGAAFTPVAGTTATATTTAAATSGTGERDDRTDAASSIFGIQAAEPRQTGATNAPVEASFEAPVSELVEQQQLDLAKDTEWLDSLAKDISRAASNNSQLRFQLNPEHLGSLKVELNNHADGTSVRLTATTEAARTILTDAQPKLIAEARAQGVRISETHVDLGGGSGGNGQRHHEPEAVIVRTSHGNREAEIAKGADSSDLYA